MLRSLFKTFKPSSFLTKNSITFRPFTVSKTSSSTSTSKRLSLSLKKEYEQEAEVMTSDYYESENNIIKEFLKKNNDWKIVEKSMQSSVEMKKVHNNEEITVIFDREREDFDAQMSQQNEQAEENQEEEPAPMMMLPFTVIVSKGDKGSLGFEMVFRHTGLSINNVIHYADSKVAIEDSANADHTRKNNYEGPDVAAYDEALQEKFFQYLEERGINDEFAQFCDTFAILKERRDYVDWLRTVGKFLEL